MHPKYLENHAIKEYLHSDKFHSDRKFMCVSAYYHTKKMGFPIGMHKHSFYEINIITQGSGYHYMENRCFPAQTGNVYVIPPHVRHGYYAEQSDFEIFHILLSYNFTNTYQEELESLPGFSLLFEIEPFLRSETQSTFFLTLNPAELSALHPDFLSLTESTKEPSPYHDLIAISHALKLISFFCEAIKKQHQYDQPYHQKNETGNSSAILHIIEFMHDHFFDELKIDFLAKMANMSRSTFLRHFFSMCKQSPSHYLNELRLKQTRKLLCETDYSITKIAQECGFFDCSHFIKLFRQKFNVSPLQFRKSLSD